MVDEGDDEPAGGGAGTESDADAFGPKVESATTLLLAELVSVAAGTCGVGGVWADAGA